MVKEISLIGMLCGQAETASFKLFVVLRGRGEFHFQSGMKTVTSDWESSRALTQISSKKSWWFSSPQFSMV